MIPASNIEPPRPINPRGVRSAQVHMACGELEPTLAFFMQRLGLRLDAIFPTDDPTVAMISAYGLQMRLARGAVAGVTTLYLLCDDPKITAGGETALTAPKGVTIKLTAADPVRLTPGTYRPWW